jgi:hypothetical protein
MDGPLLARRRASCRRSVAAHLARLDISGFDAKAPPPKTATFWSSVDANRPSEETELMDIIDALENPDALTLDQIKDYTYTPTGLRDWLKDPRNRRAIPHRLKDKR